MEAARNSEINFPCVTMNDEREMNDRGCPHLYVQVDSTILHHFHCDGYDGQNDHIIRRKCVADA